MHQPDRNGRQWSRSVCSVLALLLAMTNIAWSTDERQGHEELRSLAATHAERKARSIAPEGATVHAEAAQLDARLRLPRCASEPETFDPPGQRPGANVSVGVRCRDGVEWTLYIPVRVALRGSVVVLAAPAGRGETLSARHLRTEEHDLAGLNGGWLSDPEDAIGMVLRRPLQPGQVLTNSALEAQRLVRRGERVTVMSAGGGFAVQTQGEALADAAAGDRVRVRNVHSRSVIEGRVDAEGRVVAGR